MHFFQSLSERILWLNLGHLSRSVAHKFYLPCRSFVFLIILAYDAPFFRTHATHLGNIPSMPLILEMHDQKLLMRLNIRWPC